MEVIIAGDFCDAFRVSQEILNDHFSSLLNGIKPLVEEADFRIVNFEFPISTNSDRPIKKAGPNLRGHKESIEAVKFAGFNVCTLANNHILDQGEESCISTANLLQKSGIKTVGVGQNLEEASNVLYLDKNEEEIAIINCCEHEFSISTYESAGANPLNPIRQYYQITEARKKSDYVLVIIHGGNEHCQIPSPRMQETYRFFIDAGADAVINHHQHCFSGYENYNGNPIFYGLGNFLFDSPTQRDSNWNKGYMVRINFQKRLKPMFDLIPYIQCSNDCNIRPLEEHEIPDFEKTLNRLNSIIADKDKLRTEYERWLSNDKDNFLNIFEPYTDRISKGLYKRGLLPSFIGKKRLRIINYLFCESHLDKLRYLISYKK